MKTKTVLIIFCLTTIICQAQIMDGISISKSDFKISKYQLYDKIVWKSDYLTIEEGKPELPYYKVSYVLPVDAVFKTVTFSNKDKQQIKENLFIRPVPLSIPTNNSESIGLSLANDSIYESNIPYPNKLYDIESDDFFQGYHIITLRIYPFEYLPKSLKINYYNKLNYIIEYSIDKNSNIVRPLTQSVLRAELCKKQIKQLVRNVNDVELFGSNVQSLRDDKKIIQKSNGLQKTKALSVLDEIIPDYIIITCSSIKSAFNPLVDWKTKKGIFTIIKTTEEIDANYSGSDLQEKIRNYLIDAYSKWGAGLYVLLGGDINIVPSRMVGGIEDSKILYPTDMYYSAYYSSSWNTSGGNTFTPPTSSLQNNLKVILGRIPISNAQEVNTYESKIISYENASGVSDLSYYKNLLIADAFLLRCTDLNYRDVNGKSSLINYRDTYLPINTIRPWLLFDDYNCAGTLYNYSGLNSCCSDGIYTVRCPLGTCSKGDEELSRNSFLTAMNTGVNSGFGKFHIIYHMDHGSSQGISTSGKDKGEGVTKMDMGNLNNEKSYQIFMSGSCHSANFAEDCVAKYYLTNKGGGGVAYIGNTDSGRSSEYTQFQDFIDAIYNTTGHPDIGRYDIGSVFQNVCIKGNHYQKWRLHLLGDPEMQVWTDVPKKLSVLLNPVAVTLGTKTVNVAVSGLATGDTARICLWKGTEVYVTKEKVTNGTYPISFTANTPGEIKVTVTAHNFKPTEDSITVNSNPNPNLSVFTVDFGDGIVSGLGAGNANGQNDAGEKINLKLGIKNTGENTANGVTATLTSSSPFISITSSQGSFGNIASGATATSNQFNYIIRKDAPGKDAKGITRADCLANDPNPVSFAVTLKDTTNTSWIHKFNIDVFKDSIVQWNKTILPLGHKIGTNETVSFNISLQNIGQASSSGLKATLSRDATKDIHGYISNCTSPNNTYSFINRFDTCVSLLPFQFTVSNYPGGTTPLWFNLQVTNAYNKTWNLPFNLMDKPVQVLGTNFTSDVSEIDLYWNPAINVGGYNIYRCNADQINETEVGTYIKLNNTPVTAAFFNDTKNLSVLTKYFYKVSAVSSDGNEGPLTRYLAWTSYPHKNLYPIAMDATLGGAHSSINVADVNCDGYKEVFLGTGGGYLEGLDYQGSELYNIDNNVTSYSGFAMLGKQAWAIPAIGDLNKTGKYQIIEPTRNPKKNGIFENSVFCFSADHIDPVAIKPDLLWSLTGPKSYYRGVVLSNIDNSPDGSLEVITNSDQQGDISIYNASGMLRKNIPCMNTYGALAVADIDGSGKKEIIQASGTDINVWNCDGNNYNGRSTSSLYHLTLAGYRFVSSVIVCDIDNSRDGKKEILTFAIQQYTNQIKLFAIKCDGTTVSGFDGTKDYEFYAIDNWEQELSVGDLNHDGFLEVVTLEKNGIKVWDHTGELILPISNAPITDIPTSGLPLLADVDGDGIADIVFASNNSNNIYGYKLDGTKAFGFPIKLSSGYCYGLNVSDIDNDDHNELIAVNMNNVNMWKTNGKSAGIEWGSERHDQYNTGEYQTICDPTIITSAKTNIWNSSQNICGDLIVKSGTLTINNSSVITLGSSSMIIVMSGATLVIDSGSIINANVKAMAGSNVIIKNNGSIKLRSNGEFNTELNAVVDIPYGSITQ